MFKAEALKMLDNAPQSDDKPSRLNPVMSQKQGVEIIRKGLARWPDDRPLNALYEKRVWQMFKNQKRPKY